MPFRPRQFLLSHEIVLLWLGSGWCVMPETRKLAAVLAADVAGYSKLAGADEERTSSWLPRSSATKSPAT